MKMDATLEQIKQLRQGILTGVDSFNLGPVLLATLIDESDSLRELHHYGAAYGIHKLLNEFRGDNDRLRALFEVLNAELVRQDFYKVRFETYLGCFWRSAGEWSWYPESLDGQVIPAPSTLVQALAQQ